MINHARTLLMNVAGSGSQPGLPGEEYVPADFRARRLTTELAAARRILFGTTPDRLCLNYRLREYMTVLHSTELEEYVLALDPRITYDRQPTELLLPSPLNLVTRVSGPAGSRLYVAGDDVADIHAGRCRQEWRLEVLASDQLQIERLTKPLTKTTAEMVTESGLTAAVPLPGSPLNVRLTEPTDQIGAIWTVETQVRPASGMDDVITRLRTGLGEPTTLALFGLGPAEPFATFRNLWRDHEQSAYKLGGLLLALIYRTDAIRQVA